MSHDQRAGHPQLSPLRPYMSGDWDDGCNRNTGHGGDGGDGGWNWHDHYNETTVRTETFSEFREDIGSYSREERDLQIYSEPSRGNYYEHGRQPGFDERVSPIGMSTVDQEYYNRDSEPSYPRHTSSTAFPDATGMDSGRERQWQMSEAIPRSTEPDDSSRYYQGNCSWDIEQQEDLQGWSLFDEGSDTPSSVHSQSHSDSPLDGRSPDCFRQHRDWTQGEHRDSRSSYERRPLYEEGGHHDDAYSQNSGRKRNSSFVDSVPAHKRQRSFDSQDHSTEPRRDRSPLLHSDGGWSEQDHDRVHGWSANDRVNARNLSEERRSEASQSLIGRGQGSLSPPRRGHTPVEHSYQGDNVRVVHPSYSARQEGRWRDDDLRTREQHHRSLSPHFDGSKRDPSRFRQSQHPSLSPHSYSEAGRTQGTDLRQLLLKRGRARGSRRSASSRRDHGPQSRTSSSIGKEYTRSRQATPLSDDSLGPRRCRKGHLKDKENDKHKRKDGSQERSSPRPKSRSSECSGSQGSKAPHHKEGKDKKGQTSREKGGKIADCKVTLPWLNLESEEKSKESKRSTEKQDGKKGKVPAVKSVASASKPDDTTRAPAKELKRGQTLDMEPAIHSSIESTDHHMEDLAKEDATLSAPADDQHLTMKEAPTLPLETKFHDETDLIRSVVVDNIERDVQQADTLDSVSVDSSQTNSQWVVLNSGGPESAGSNAPEEDIHQSVVLPPDRALTRGNASARTEDVPVPINAAAAENVQHSVETASIDDSSLETVDATSSNLQPSPSQVLESTRESMPLADAKDSALTTIGMCAAAYGYTVTMEKKTAIADGEKSSAWKSDEESRHPDIHLKGGTEIQQMANDGKDKGESVVCASSATESVADNLYMTGMEAEDGSKCKTLIRTKAYSKELADISERPCSPEIQYSNDSLSEKPLSSPVITTEENAHDAVPAHDTLETDLPFGYSKTWNSRGDAHRKSLHDESVSNVPTLDLSLGSDRNDIVPMEVVSDASSDGPEELRVAGESSSAIQRPYLTGGLQVSPTVVGHATLGDSQRYSPSSPTKDFESSVRTVGLSVFTPAAAEPIIQAAEMASTSRLPETPRERLACALEFQGEAAGKTLAAASTEIDNGSKSKEWPNDAELGGNAVTSPKAKSATTVLPSPTQRAALVDGAQTRLRPRIVYVSGVKRKAGRCMRNDATKHEESSEHPSEEADVVDSGFVEDVSQSSVDYSSDHNDSRGIAVGKEADYVDYGSDDEGSRGIAVDKEAGYVDYSSDDKGSDRILANDGSGIYTEGSDVDATLDCKGDFDSGRSIPSPPAAHLEATQGSTSEQSGVFVLDNGKTMASDETRSVLDEQDSFACTTGKKADNMLFKGPNNIEYNQSDNQNMEDDVDGRTNATMPSTRTTNSQGNKLGGYSESEIKSNEEVCTEGTTPVDNFNEDTEVRSTAIFPCSLGNAGVGANAESIADDVAPRTPYRLRESNPGPSQTEVQTGAVYLGTQQAEVLNSTIERENKAEGRYVGMDNTEAEVVERVNANEDFLEIDAKDAQMQVERIPLDGREDSFLSVGIPTKNSVPVNEQEYFEKDIPHGLTKSSLGRSCQWKDDQVKDAQMKEKPDLAAVDECSDLGAVSTIQKVPHGTQVAEATAATTEHRYYGIHRMDQGEECGENGDRLQRNRGSVEDTVNKERCTEDRRLRMENLRRKKEELQEVYKRECFTFIQVAKMMVSKEPNLESELVQTVRQNLFEMGQRCVHELERFARLEMSKECPHYLLQFSNDVTST